MTDELLDALTFATGMLFTHYSSIRGAAATSHDGIEVSFGFVDDGRIRVMGVYEAGQFAEVEVRVMFDTDAWTVEQAADAVTDCLVLVRAQLP